MSKMTSIVNKNFKLKSRYAQYEMEQTFNTGRLELFQRLQVSVSA